VKVTPNIETSPAWYWLSAYFRPITIRISPSDCFAFGLRLMLSKNFIVVSDLLQSHPKNSGEIVIVSEINRLQKWSLGLDV
jgi:hypothetical protein